MAQLLIWLSTLRVQHGEGPTCKPGRFQSSSSNTIAAGTPFVGGIKAITRGCRGVFMEQEEAAARTRAAFLARRWSRDSVTRRGGLLLFSDEDQPKRPG